MATPGARNNDGPQRIPRKTRPRIRGKRFAARIAAERNFGKAALISQRLFAEGQRREGKCADVLELAPPEDGRQHRMTVLILRGHFGERRIEGPSDSSRIGHPETAGDNGLQTIDCRFEDSMEEISERQRIEEQRLFALLRLLPAEAVGPKIAERIARQFGERGRRLPPIEGRDDRRVIRSDETVMGGEPLCVPIDPAS